MSGYSGKPLFAKLGLKSGIRYCVINPPDNYELRIADAPADCLRDDDGRDLDFIHYFPENVRQLRAELPTIKTGIVNTGMIWISWPKKSSGMQTDITEAEVRHAGLTEDLVDVKICAADEVWSALKFVIPKSLRG